MHNNDEPNGASFIYIFNLDDISLVLKEWSFEYIVILIGILPCLIWIYLHALADIIIPNCICNF